MAGKIARAPGVRSAVKRRILIFGGAAALVSRRVLADLCLKEQKAAPDSKEKKRHNPVPDAIKRAIARGVDVLAIVIPDDDSEKYRRGRVIGAWLNHGTPEQIAPLARYELVCATTSELMISVDSRREPVMVRINPDSSKPPQWLDAELKPMPKRGIVRDDEDDEDQILDENVAAVARLIADGRAPTPAALADVKRRYLDEPPPGSHWAESSGCGTRVEDTAEEKRIIEERAKHGHMRAMVGIGCGMGHVPEKARRFLYYFAHGPDDSEVQ
jgi:hypothetical protein